LDDKCLFCGVVVREGKDEYYCHTYPDRTYIFFNPVYSGHPLCTPKDYYLEEFGSSSYKIRTGGCGNSSENIVYHNCNRNLTLLEESSVFYTHCLTRTEEEKEQFFRVDLIGLDQYPQSYHREIYSIGNYFGITKIMMGLYCNGIRDNIDMGATITTLPTGANVPAILLTNYKFSIIHRLRHTIAHEYTHLQELILGLKISEVRADVMGSIYATVDMWKSGKMCNYTPYMDPYSTILKGKDRFYFRHRGNIILNTINQVQFILDFLEFESQEQCSTKNVIKK
jgi:hypothetical protein